jgi:subtilisin family serine protease
MELTSGRSAIAVALIDGPVVTDHPELANESIRVLMSLEIGSSGESPSARSHGTFVAGILSAKRGSRAPAICPGCTLMVRPIFLQPARGSDVPSAHPDQLADAIVHCVDEGARVLNLSVALSTPAPNHEPRLERVLDYAAARGALVIAAAGNQAVVGSSPITRHPAVIPVAACDLDGRPTAISNLGDSISRRGLMAPGAGITSLGANGSPLVSSGTSAATPFVTGAVALLLSALPRAAIAEVKRAITRSELRRTTIVPPLVNAWNAYLAITGRRRD